MSNIKAIIFDMDGVLIDAREWHYESLNRALNYFGLNIARIDHLARYDGLPTKDKLLLLSEKNSLPLSLHTLINELKQKFTMQIIYEKCAPEFCHKMALSTLRRNGYKLSLASNSIKASIDAMMSRSGLLEYLEFTLSNQDVVHGKPNPEIYLKSIAMHGCEPHECLIVEDNPHGIAAAKASGAHVLEVSNPSDVTYDKIKSEILKIEEQA